MFHHILNICLTFSSYINTVTSLSCGIDSSPGSHVYEGVALMETYPWLGVLYYPHKNKRFTTGVVLVTRQMVIATALEIDKLPKDDFRARARVVIGHNCSASRGIGIRSYNYHPDYSSNTFSAIALIQLETDHARILLRPICPPPKTLMFQKEHFYAMVLSEGMYSKRSDQKRQGNNCNKSKMRIHKMMFISTDECKSFYRRTELDIDTMWPTYTACARSVKGGECVWRSGAILVVKVGNRWSLLGFGVYGPGCQAPARFLDYGMYHEWVQRSVARIGRPAITKLASNMIVLRRSMSKVQRFGPCDKEEMVAELYTDSTAIMRKPDPMGQMAPGRMHYNLTIVADVEYSCVVLRADYHANIKDRTPTMRLRRHCTAHQQSGNCFTGLQFTQIEFYVEILFHIGLTYSIKAYGRRVKALDPYRAHKYANVHVNLYPRIFNHTVYKSLCIGHIKDKSYPWYGEKNMTSRIVSYNTTTSTTTTTTTTTGKPTTNKKSKKLKRRLRFEV